MNETIFRKLAAYGVVPDDINERFARASGPGGQHVNKTSIAVTLVCRKKKLTITAQDSRSQTRNRQLAWQRLLTALEEDRQQQAAARRALTEKRRRATRKRPRAVKERNLEKKRQRSQLKQLRRKPL